MRQTYISITDTNKLQTDIMLFITDWVKEMKTPIPQREIVNAMQQQGVKDFTTLNAIAILVRKGYIRQAVVISKQRMYVQLRTI